MTAQEMLQRLYAEADRLQEKADSLNDRDPMATAYTASAGSVAAIAATLDREMRGDDAGEER